MSNTIVTKRPETRELIIERTFGAPQETVWMCWTDPAHFAKWWGPHGSSTSVHEMEVRPQGVLRYTMVADDSSWGPSRGMATYNEVDKPEGLDFVDSFADSEWQAVPGTETDTTVRFKPNGEGTSVTITTRFGTVDELEERVAMGVEQGMGEAFDRLDSHIAQLDTTDYETLTSADGATIAFERSGSGPALVLVNTTMEDRTAFAGLAGLLDEDFTVYRYDRRGRGDSDDPQPYDPKHEIEDLEALIDHAGGSAALASGSGGCTLCLDAATALGSRVTGLYLFDPPFIVNDDRPPMPADYVDQVTTMVEEDRRSDAVEFFMVHGVGVPEEFIGQMKQDPSWDEMEKYAHTLAYDGLIHQGVQDGKPLPTDRWDVDAPAAIVVGADNVSWLHDGGRALEQLLPNGAYTALPDADHSAFWMAPDAVAASITEKLT